MAANFGKMTLAALNAQAEAAADRHAARVRPIVAEAVAPLLARIDALTAEIAAMSARMPAPAPSGPPQVPPTTTPPVTTPDPVPPAAASGCVVTVISATGAAWRWDATAAARRDSLGLRAMTEVPTEIAGCTSLRLVADLGAGWAIVVPRNDIAMRAGGGTARYSLQVHLDGKLVLDERDIVTPMYRGQRPCRLGQLPAWPLPSTDSLIQRGLVARYHQGAAAEAKLASWAKVMAAPDWQARDSARGITQYMPQTGARDDIGPVTGPQAAYLITRDRRALDMLVGQAEAATTIPWHLFDAAAGSWLSVERWPRIWTDGRGGEPGKGTLLQPIPDTGWTPESAHQPDLSYVPYLLTGERWMLDNLQAQAAWNIVYQWEGTRGPSDMVVVDRNQTRGAAWALRQIDEAAWASPEGSAEKTYFAKASQANWSWIMSKIPEWTKAQGAMHGWLPGEYGNGGAMGPWQQDYVAGTALSAARGGNEDAKTYLRWARNFLVGRFAYLGRDAIAYNVAVSDPGATVLYGDWGKAREATVARGMSNGSGWPQSQGNYGQLARATLVGLADVLGDAEAARWAAWLQAEGAPFTDAASLARDAQLYVIAP